MGLQDAQQSFVRETIRRKQAYDEAQKAAAEGQQQSDDAEEVALLIVPRRTENTTEIDTLTIGDKSTFTSRAGETVTSSLKVTLPGSEKGRAILWEHLPEAVELTLGDPKNPLTYLNFVPFGMVGRVLGKAASAVGKGAKVVDKIEDVASQGAKVLNTIEEGTEVLYHGTTAYRASRIVSRGFRAKTIYFAEEMATAEHFAKWAKNAQFGSKRTIIKLEMPESLARRFKIAFENRKVLGEDRIGAKYIEIQGGSDYERILTDDLVPAFNEAMKKGEIKVSRLKLIE